MEDSTRCCEPENIHLGDQIRTLAFFYLFFSKIGTYFSPDMYEFSG
nr:MAG TPA: hypothetical protein [Caudoviricetes sp.]